MTDLRHILRKARRRRLAQRALRRSAVGMLAGLIAACLLLIAAKGLALDLPGLVYPLVAGLGLLAGLISAFAVADDPVRLAADLDRAYRLKDRLASAETIVIGGLRRQDPAFADLVRRDADRLAAKLDVRSATPIRIPNLWLVVLGVGVLLWLGDMLLPNASWASRESLAQTAQRGLDAQRERAEVADAIGDVLDEFEDRDEALDPATQNGLDALEDLADQLSGEGELDPADARDESARQLTDLADRLDDQARREIEATDEFARRFSGMEQPDAPMSAEEFSEALKRGDLGDAAELLEQLMQRSESMPATEREALADHLEELARRAEEAGRRDRNQAAQRDPVEQTLRDQGLDEQTIDDLLDGDPGDVDDIERALEERNIDEEVARDLARDIERLREQKAVDGQVERDAQKLADALKDAADQIDEPQQPEPPSDERQPDQRDATERPEQSAPPDQATREKRTSEDRPQQQTGKDESGPNERREEAPNERTEQQSDRNKQEEQRTGQEQSEQKPQETGEKPSQRDAEKRQAGEGENRQRAEEKRTAEQQEKQAGEQKRGAEQQKQAGEQKPGAERQKQVTEQKDTGEPKQAVQPKQVDGERPATPPTTPPSTPPSQTPQQQPPPSGTNQQPQRETAAPDGSAPEAAKPQPQPGAPKDVGEQPRPAGTPQQQAQPGAEREQPPSPADAIRRLAERRRNAESQREAAERARDAARRMAENMSPEERQRWAEQWQRQLGVGEGAGDDSRPGFGDAPLPDRNADAPGPIDIDEVDPVDITGDEVADRTIAEWLSDAPPEGEPQRTTGSSRGEHIRRAQRAAERAVDESTVPSRFHRFIRRYFDRLDRTIDEAAGKDSAGKSSKGDADS
jgi:hypothetical protein